MITEVGQWLRQHLFTKKPNLPKLAGDALGILGLLFLVQALKTDWYGVPESFIENTDNAYQTVDLTSPWEKRFKFVILIILPIVIIGFFIIRKRIFTRTKLQGNFAAIILLIGFAFCQLTIIDEGKLSKIAAMHVANHDNLTWYGGDVTTSREQEINGSGSTYIAKDLPLVVSSVPLPYRSNDLASIRDFLQWSGMSPAFWYYFRKGWGFLILAGIFILISAICVRLKGEDKGLGSEVIGYVLKRSAVILALWFTIVFVRTQLCAHSLEQARQHYENMEIEDSLAYLHRAGKIMPSTHWDSSLIYQRGGLEKRLQRQTPGSMLYDGFLFEQNGRNQAAYENYLKVTKQDQDQPAKLEAYRCIMRLAILHFNSDEFSKAEKALTSVENQYPALVKLLFLRFMIAVKLGDYYQACEWQRKLYAAGKSQQMNDRRGYLASTHQYLAQLAYDQGLTEAAWQHNIFRQELNKDGAVR